MAEHDFLRPDALALFQKRYLLFIFLKDVSGRGGRVHAKVESSTFGRWNADLAVTLGVGERGLQAPCRQGPHIFQREACL